MNTTSITKRLSDKLTMITASMLVCIGVFASGCAGPRTPVDQVIADDAAADSISRITEEGPVKAEVILAPAHPRLGDSLSLSLIVTAQPGVTVEMPAFGEALGRFSILDFTPRQRNEDDGSTVATQTYTLQAPMSGRQRIPPLRLEYIDARNNNADAPEAYRELLTEELVVEIESVLPEGSIVTALKPPRPALPEHRGSLWSRLWPTVLLLGAVAALSLWLFGLWQKRALVQARVTAYDRALARLARLEQSGIPKSEVADDWYVELSDIVRRYIEDRYGVRAPELTTEEFLQESQRSAQLGTVHRSLLSEFLERCDRVKFAAYAPGADESRQALALARRFLGETQLSAEPDERMAA